MIDPAGWERDAFKGLAQFGARGAGADTIAEWIDYSQKVRLSPSEIADVMARLVAAGAIEKTATGWRVVARLRRKLPLTATGNLASSPKKWERFFASLC